MKKILFTLFLLCIGISYINAQQVTSHVPWTKEDSAAINALALYPDSVRREIFTACEYPAIIVNVASLQKNSSTAFTDLVTSYSKTKQEDVWNLSRYPDLISKLVQGGKKSKEEIETILTNYPAEIHDIALKFGRSEYDLLKSIDDLQTQTNQQFAQLVSTYPIEVQKVFTDLLQLPEVMSLLNDHLSLSVRVGDHYKRDPEWVMHKSDSTAQAEAKINAEQLQDWKQTLLQDSDAQTEMKAAANEYATDNGYNQSDVDAPQSDVDVNNYVVYPYSYWFGYPTWYPYSYWYPYPYWYDWGFYYGPYGNLVVFGFPSYYFTNWYFWGPRHWHKYPHLGSAYIHHYYGSHRLNTMSRQVVHNWVHANRNYLPADFIRNDATRVAALKQYGELNEKVMNKDGSINTAARDEAFTKNPAKYSALNSHPEQAKIPEEKQGTDVRQPYTRQPAVAPQRNSQPANVTKPKYNYNNVQRAQQYHTGSWQQTQPTYHPAPQYSAPARSAPAPSGGGHAGGGRR
ncbi:MAG TPA: hypothetical protein VK806_10020 [Bacteroidia bacterium]|jgi:hypothetical protein|nr:hypothetical protein [Bacteroidia bacterium]